MSIIGSNILAGASGQAGYNLNNSLRFRSSSPGYLSRTPSSTTNQQKWTYSTWMKLGGAISGNTAIFVAGTSGNSFCAVAIDGNSNLSIFWYVGAVTIAAVTSSAKLRDPSAWYHLVVTVDTTQATAANRIIVYLNGVSQTVTATYPSQNYNGLVNSNIAHYVGQFGSAGYNNFDGYMTEINFVDGSQLTPSSFGETSLTTGQWIPKAYSGTYGTNGFYLKFADASAATAAAIGKDSSGNGNNWTPSGISVTAGVTYDAMLDVPTNTSATVANYAIVNPLDIAGTPTISDGNLKFTNGAAAWGGSRTGFAMTSGKWYWEVTIISANTISNGIDLGIANSSTIAAGIGQTNKWVYNNNTGGGRKSLNGTVSAYGVTYVANDIVGIAFDADAGSITFYVNNSSQGVMASTGLPNPAFPYTETYSSDSVAVNFGQRPFTYTAPSGFVALNTYNLPTPTILQGNKYMDATLYTGTGASLAITNAGAFKPDLVWVKGRSGATDHALYDSVRGTTKDLVSNSTAAETTQTTGLTAFGTGGFTVGALAKMNTSAATYVGWQWQAGQGTTSSNTSGSITSTVSVNTTAGFSVVTWTGTGANATVGHGLGVAPKFFTVKRRSAVGNWMTWHTSLTGTGPYIILSSTNAAATGAWNNTLPTSTVFSLLGSDTDENANGSTYVAYCWAEIAGFSAFGSYTGNGSADGPFVYLGFRPKYVVIKRTDGAGAWYVLDSVRNTYNVMNLYVEAQDTAAEATFTFWDFVSNGFKLRTSTTNINGSSQSFIYMAFAESPFKSSLAR